MKCIWSLLLASVFTFSVIAQETLQVDITKLNAQELFMYQKLKKEAQSGISLDNLSPEKIDRYSQIGKAFGLAFRECWTTVSTDAERFAQSSAGKWAMVLVSWKIMGEDAVSLVSKFVRFVTGGALLLVGVPFFIYIYLRNCVSIPILVSKTKVAFLTVKKEYKGLSTPIHNDAGPWGYATCFAVFLGTCVLIMFA